MIVASDADDAWWPPTFRPSSLSRMWLALWIVHDDSHSTLRSSSDENVQSIRHVGFHEQMPTGASCKHWNRFHCKPE